MSVLDLVKAQEAANGNILVWNPSKPEGAGWTWLHLLNASSDLTAWGGPKAPAASASAATKKAHATFLAQLIARAEYLAGNSPIFGTSGTLVDVETIARSIRIVADPLTKTTLPANGLWFPVAPENYEVGQTFEWEEVDIIGLGRTAHSGVKGLPSIEVEAILPGSYDPAVCLAISSQDYFVPPAEWIEYVTKLASSMDVFRLVVGNRRSYEGLKDYVFNDLMRITDIRWGEQSGTPFDRKVRVSFSGWRKQSIRFTGGAYALARNIPKVHRVKPGQDYQDLAKKYYGDVGMWKAIAKHNKDFFSKKVRSWTSKKNKKSYEISFSKKQVKLPRV